MESYNPGFAHSENYYRASASASGYGAQQRGFPDDDGTESHVERSFPQDEESHDGTDTRTSLQTNALYQGTSQDVLRYSAGQDEQQINHAVNQNTWDVPQTDSSPDNMLWFGVQPMGNPAYTAQTQYDPQQPNADPLEAQIPYASSPYQLPMHTSTEPDAFPDVTGNTRHGSCMLVDTTGAATEYNSVSTAAIDQYYAQQSHQGAHRGLQTQFNESMELYPLDNDLGTFTLQQEDFSTAEDDPWSIHKRYNHRSRVLLSQVDHLVGKVSTSDASHTSDAGGNASNSTTTYPSTSASLENHGATGWGQDSGMTIRPGSSTYQPSQPSHSYTPHNDSSRDQRLDTTAIPQLSVWCSPPVPTGSNPFQGSYIPNLASPHNDNLCPGTPSQTSSSAPASPVNSTTSDILRCELCIGAEFTGDYRKGNLARHKREKHKDGIRRYACADGRCDREFRRKDARLKHYRKHHSHLASGPAVPRKN